MMQRSFQNQDILEMEKIYRLNLMNSLTGFKSANLIATKNDTTTNLAIFSSVIHLGSNPPLVGFMVRPTKVERHTYSNIKGLGYYTINAVTKDMIVRAHQTSAKYPKNVSEFDVCKFVEDYKGGFQAPFVKDSPIQLGVRLIEEHHVKANDTLLVVGEVDVAHVQADCLQENGTLALEEANIVTISGLDSYYATQKLTTLAYARPE